MTPLIVRHRGNQKVNELRSAMSDLVRTRIAHKPCVLQLGREPSCAYGE